MGQEMKNIRFGFGQSTLEYLIILAVVMGVLVTVGFFVKFPS